MATRPAVRAIGGLRGSRRRRSGRRYCATAGLLQTLAHGIGAVAVAVVKAPRAGITGGRIFGMQATGKHRDGTDDGQLQDQQQKAVAAGASGHESATGRSSPLGGQTLMTREQRIG